MFCFLLSDSINSLFLLVQLTELTWLDTGFDRLADDPILLSLVLCLVELDFLKQLSTDVLNKKIIKVKISILKVKIARTLIS